MDSTIWDHSTFSKNRDRLLERGVMVLLFDETAETARVDIFLGSPLASPVH